MQDFNYHPYETHTVKLLSDIEIAYITEGEGPKTIIFLHGLGSYLLAWKKNIIELKKHYRCIAIDLPNYGKSSKGTYAFTPSFFAEKVNEFIQKKQLKNIILVGHSMGGQVAVHVALQYPKSVEKMVLIAPAGFEEFSEKEMQWFKKLMTPTLIKATPEKQIKINFGLNFHDGKLPADAQFMYEDRLSMRESDKEYDYYCNMIPTCIAGMLDEPIFERLKDIKTPSLIMYGEQDLLIPNKYLHPKMTTKEVATKGQELIPNSQLIMLPSCGHFVQWECATEVNQNILNFI